MQKATYLKFWVMPVGGYETSQIIGEEISSFEKLHPGIKIDCSVIPWSLAWKKIVTAAKSRQLPDVFLIGNTWTRTLAAINALADLTKEVTDGKLKNSFYPAAWATCEIKNSGKVMALPWSADARMIFYRKDLFEKAGLTARSLETWDSFTQACLALSELKGKDDNFAGPLGVGDIKDSGLLHEIAPWVWSGGGDFLTPDGFSAAFCSENAVKGMKYYFDLMDRDIAPIRDRKVPYYPTYDFFVLKKFAMIIAGPFAAPSFIPGFFEAPTSLRDSEDIDKFGVAFLPAGPGGRFSFLGGSNLAISSYSQNKPEAWQFLKFLASKEFQVRQYKSIGLLPSGIEAFASLFYEGTPNQQVLIETYKNYGKSYAQVDMWGSIEFILTDFMGKILDGIKQRRYSGDFLAAEAKKYAEEVDYLLSL
ncbi:MAG: extracellular solute-binding protein [Candidatus Omnitrophica bacterium]|nr:extracellular solute-binding protein [Candidatus Omnitrophota bacterium]